MTSWPSPEWCITKLSGQALAETQAPSPAPACQCRQRVRTWWAAFPESSTTLSRGSELVSKGEEAGLTWSSAAVGGSWTTRADSVGSRVTRRRAPDLGQSTVLFGQIVLGWPGEYPKSDVRPVPFALPATVSDVPQSARPACHLFFFSSP